METGESVLGDLGAFADVEVRQGVTQVYQTTQAAVVNVGTPLQTQHLQLRQLDWEKEKAWVT